MFCRKFLDILAEFNVETTWIQIEITESILMTNELQVQVALDILKKMGLKLRSMTLERAIPHYHTY